MPRISVVIPAYNSAAYLSQTLQSVHRQTLPVAEIIVVDDGSTDESVALAQAHGARVISQENAGPAAARNTGIRASTGEWVAFLDADDAWMEQKLERQLQAAAENPRIGLIFSDFSYIDEKGAHRRTGFDELKSMRQVAREPGNRGCVILPTPQSLGEAFLQSMVILTSTLVVRRDVLVGDDLFDVTMRCAEDYELYLRLIVRTAAAALDEPLVAYRRHTQSISADLDLDLISREQLAARCATSPQRYPAGAAGAFQAQRLSLINRAATFALRSGSFDMARKRALLGLRARPNAHALAVLMIASLCDNPLGHALHPLLRSAWSRRHRKYQNVA